MSRRSTLGALLAMGCAMLQGSPSPAQSTLPGVRPIGPPGGNPIPLPNPPPIAINLQRWTFESGNLDGWTATGRAFENQPTYGENVVAGRLMSYPVGGDYWKDIPRPIGVRGSYWIGTSENRHAASDPVGRTQGDVHVGTLTSAPFDLSAATQAISFLVSGGDMIDHEKVELLMLVPKGKGTPAPGPVIPGGSTAPPPLRPVPVATEPYDYVPVAGVPAVTGHNSETFRREVWSVGRVDHTKKYVIRITDDSSGEWGHINVDDFQFLSNVPTDSTTATVLDMKRRTARVLRVDRPMPLFGSADLHTHPMSHLAMGKKLMHGVPFVGGLLPAGTHGCNQSDRRAMSVDEALGDCNSTHGGWGTDNTCGNYFRAGIINFAFDSKYVFRLPLDRNAHGDHPHPGYPAFATWPHYSSATHQQMYVDWIRRAYQGGLRVMVALAVNSELLGEVVSGDGPKDDKGTTNLQLDEMLTFVNKFPDFMEVARTSADVRRIVANDKLAVILGVEIDNIGNFNYATVPATESAVKAEIQRLFNEKSVRYIFPVHLVDNKFGGTAVIDALFNISNKFAASRPLPVGTPIPPGLLYDVETSRDPKVTYRMGLVGPAGTNNAVIAGVSGFLQGLGEIPFPPAFDAVKCPIGKLGCTDQFRVLSSLLTPDPQWDIYPTIPGGHANKKGLSPLGEVAVREMMRLGMLIDIDHGSEKTANRILEIAAANNYPVNSGHDGFRGAGYPDEKGRTDVQLDTLRRLGAMMGVGCADNNAAGFLDNYRYGLGRMGGGHTTLGSDINGFVTLPAPRFAPGVTIGYSASIPPAFRTRRVAYAAGGANEPLVQYRFGAKTWDYNTEGVAHMGLFPDYYQDLKNLGMTTVERAAFFSAPEHFAQMWEGVERARGSIH